jgi:hypothetical protein
VSFIPPSPLIKIASPEQLALLAFAGYLMIKTSNAAGKRAGIERRERAEARRADRKSGATTASSAKDAKSAGPAPGRPKASKRYTPPKKSKSAAKRR